MILTTENILATPRCEPWNDERTIEFMNSGVYTNIGEKSISEFIESEGILGITQEEIFWIIINNLNLGQLVNLNMKLIEYYIDISGVLVDNYTNKLVNGTLEFDYIINTVNNLYTNCLNINKDVTYDSKLYKLIIIFCTEYKNCGNFINTTKKMYRICNQTFPDINYNLVLNYLSELYN